MIPGNDDAIRSVSLVTRLIADATIEGRQEGKEAVVTRATGPEIEPEPEPAVSAAVEDSAGAPSPLAAVDTTAAQAEETIAGGDEAPAPPSTSAAEGAADQPEAKEPSDA